MKQKLYTLFCLLMISNLSFSQVDVNIINMQYINGQTIPNCGTIDFGTDPTVRVQFTVKLEKPNNQIVGTSDLFIYTLNPQA